MVTSDVDRSAVGVAFQVTVHRTVLMSGSGTFICEVTAIV
jgi:hypothetical protein